MPEDRSLAESVFFADAIGLAAHLETHDMEFAAHGLGLLRLELCSGGSGPLSVAARGIRRPLPRSFRQREPVHEVNQAARHL